MKAKKTPAIAERGEHSIALAGVAYKLRPTYTAIVTIEQRSGRSLRQLAAAANTGDLSFEQIGLIGGELIRAGAEDDITSAVSDERIAELVFEEGAPHVVARFAVVLLDALTGGRTTTGEAKAPGVIL